MSYHIFDKAAVDMICREYGGDPRVMVIALNGAVSTEMNELCEAADRLSDALDAADRAEAGAPERLAAAREALEQAARRYSWRRLHMERVHG